MSMVRLLVRFLSSSKRINLGVRSMNKLQRIDLQLSQYLELLEKDKHDPVLKLKIALLLTEKKKLEIYERNLM